MIVLIPFMKFEAFKGQHTLIYNFVNVKDNVTADKADEGKGLFFHYFHRRHEPLYFEPCCWISNIRLFVICDNRCLLSTCMLIDSIIYSLQKFLVSFGSYAGQIESRLVTWFSIIYILSEVFESLFTYAQANLNLHWSQAFLQQCSCRNVSYDI